MSWKEGDLIKLNEQWGRVASVRDVMQQGDVCIVLGYHQVHNFGPYIWDILHTPTGTVDAFHQDYFDRVE